MVLGGAALGLGSWIVWAGPEGAVNQSSALDGPSGAANRLDRGHLIEWGEFRTLSLAFSPDSKRVFSLEGVIFKDVKAAVRNVASQGKAFVFTTHPTNAGSVICPALKLLATPSGESSINLIDLSTNRLVRTLKPQLTSGPLCFSPGGNLLAIGSTRGLMLYNVRLGKLLRTVPHDDYVDQLQFSPDGGKLFVTFMDSKPRVIRVADGRRLRLPAWFSSMGRTDAFALSPDGATAATSWWEMVALWSTRSGKRRRKLRSGLVKVESIAFSPDGKTLALGGQSRGEPTIEFQSVQ